MPWRAAAVVIALATAGSAATEQKSGELMVVRDADRLTVHATDVRLSRVLEEIARATGADVHGQISARDVSASMEALPLAEVLTRLLENENFTLAYGADGTLRTIELLAPPSSPSAAVTRAQPTAPSRATPPDDEAAARRTVRVSARLGAVLGTRTPPATDVIHAAFRQDNARLRADAQRAAIAALATDPGFERIFAKIFAAVDDATLVEIFRGWGRARGAAFLRRVVTSTRIAALRDKAADVLIALRHPVGSA
jgi:hypothetical protein